VALVFFCRRIYLYFCINSFKLKSFQIIIIDGFAFRDLNKNGKLDVYEDKRQPVELRVSDLLNQMILEEKAGTMFINMTKVINNCELAEHSDFKNILSFRLPTLRLWLFQRPVFSFSLT
jgi:hypothetical protein